MIAWFAGGMVTADDDGEQRNMVHAPIDWRDFLARHDMLWKRLPGNWREAPWTGNGMLGSMFWIEGDALRIQVFRGDVQAHRPMTQGFSGYTRARLQIGSHYLAPVGKPAGCDLRLSYYDAEVVGTINTEKGAWNIRHFTHAEDMAIVTELEASRGEGPVQLTWQPDKNAMPTRPGYARTKEDLPRLQKQYKSRYPTEPFPPNPDAVVNSVDDVNICIQDMLGGSRHCTAWRMIEAGKGKQRLVVSIANRWPKETGDPVSEAVAVVKKVCALTGPAYDAWKQTHYELAMLRWACHAVVTAGKRLKVNDADLDRYRDILENLIDYPVDETGFMVGRGMPFNRNHRHWCHMQMMHPLQLVTGKTPAERELMEKSIRNFAEVNKGGGDIAPFQFTGTSAIWSLLGEGDKALSDLHRFMGSPINCPNSMNHYGGRNPCLETPVYAAQNVHEMLLQCYDEFPASGEMQAAIRVFPAVPDQWPNAVFHNLRTVGAFLVSAVHKDGRTQWVRVQSLAGEPCRIKPNLPGPVRAAGKRGFALRDLGGGVYELDLRQGEEALLYCGDRVPKPTVEPSPAQKAKCNRYGLGR